MSQPFWRANPNAPFATLIRIARNYCHPETDEDAYGDLKLLAQSKSDEEMNIFKRELHQAILRPSDIPEDELYEAVQFADGSDERFLRRLWRDLYPEEPVPSRS